MLSSLKNKSAILTGASRGIGLAIARALQKEGVRLALLSRTKPPAGIRGKFIRCDPADIAKMVVFLLKQPEHIDIPELIVRRFKQ